MIVTRWSGIMRPSGDILSAGGYSDFVTDADDFRELVGKAVANMIMSDIPIQIYKIPPVAGVYAHIYIVHGKLHYDYRLINP
jgi:hypothetical protein